MIHAHQTAPTQFVEANGIRFAYRRFGKAQSKGQPITWIKVRRDAPYRVRSTGEAWLNVQTGKARCVSDCKSEIKAAPLL
jgi:hypothetical protein